MTVSHDERVKNSQLLIDAAQACNLEDIQRLIPISYPQWRDNAALVWSVNKNHVEAVKCLALVSDLNVALGVAAEWRRIECLQVLLPLASGKDIVFAAGDAAYEGHMDALQLLLQYCDPTDQESFPLQMAAVGKREEIVKYLIPISNPSEALGDLDNLDHEAAEFLNDILARQQKATIEQNIVADGHRALVRKI